jgi:hypothetical protein
MLLTQHAATIIAIPAQTVNTQSVRHPAAAAAPTTDTGPAAAVRHAAAVDPTPKVSARTAVEPSAETIEGLSTPLSVQQYCRDLAAKPPIEH